MVQKWVFVHDLRQLFYLFVSCNVHSLWYANTFIFFTHQKHVVNHILISIYSVMTFSSWQTPMVWSGFLLAHLLMCVILRKSRGFHFLGDLLFFRIKIFINQIESTIENKLFFGMYIHIKSHTLHQFAIKFIQTIYFNKMAYKCTFKLSNLFYLVAKNNWMFYI